MPCLVRENSKIGPLVSTLSSFDCLRLSHHPEFARSFKLPTLWSTFKFRSFDEVTCCLLPPLDSTNFNRSKINLLFTKKWYIDFYSNSKFKIISSRRKITAVTLIWLSNLVLQWWGCLYLSDHFTKQLRKKLI